MVVYGHTGGYKIAVHRHDATANLVFLTSKLRARAALSLGPICRDAKSRSVIVKIGLCYSVTAALAQTREGAKWNCQNAIDCLMTAH